MSEAKTGDAPPNSSSAVVRVGEVIAGKYKVERILGEGGMGVVVAARHMQLDERVALKFLRPQALRNPETVARFAQEARAAVKLKSEHVARVHDVGIREDGSPFMVMEYLQGRDLARLLEIVGALGIEEAVELVIQACEGIAEAHARGIIHRDIKPENLFLVEHGHGWRSLKVLDFGISKAALTGSLEGSESSNIRTQSIMGSPCYMSPEQLRSTQSVDHRADIWSLGSVLFELLTDQTAFDHDRPLTELVATILEQPAPRLRTLLPDAPEELEAVVARCLERDREKRFRNAGELAVALLPFAPKRSRTAVERAVAVTRSAGLSDARLVVPPSIAPPPGDNASLAKTALAVPSPASTPMLAAFGADQRVPTLMGKYRIIARLGRGGMADVFLALARGPLGVNKLVVIKRLRQGLGEEEPFRQMFVDEARLAARLNHPNVVQTYEVGNEGGAYFIAMEYLEGQPLNVITREARRVSTGLDSAASARIVSDALAGLHYAHELKDYDGSPLSIIHRDVSPHNMFVTYEGQVKLVDFGIAKAAFRSAETEVGVLKGKVAYMAPEQGMGEAIDRRADIFSMGIVLWELLAGRRLMPAESAPVILHRMVNLPIPSLKEAAPDVDPALEAIVSRALQKAPDDRFQSAKEMRDALELYLAHCGDRAPRQDAMGELVGGLFAGPRENVRKQVQACMESAALGEEGEITSLLLDPRLVQSQDSGHEVGSERRTGRASKPRGLADELEHGDTADLGPDASVRRGTMDPSAASVGPAAKSGRGRAWIALVAVFVLGGVLLVFFLRGRTAETGPVVAAAPIHADVPAPPVSAAAALPQANPSSSAATPSATASATPAPSTNTAAARHVTQPVAKPQHPAQPDLDIRMQR